MLDFFKNKCYQWFLFLFHTTLEALLRIDFIQEHFLFQVKTYFILWKTGKFYKDSLNILEYFERHYIFHFNFKHSKNLYLKTYSDG